jgi:hypothetical protein
MNRRTKLGITLIALALSIAAAVGPLSTLRSVTDAVTVLGGFLPSTAAPTDESRHFCSRRTLYATSLSLSVIMFIGGTMLFFQGVKRTENQESQQPPAN